MKAKSGYSAIHMKMRKGSFDLSKEIRWKKLMDRKRLVQHKIALQGCVGNGALLPFSFKNQSSLVNKGILIEDWKRLKVRMLKSLQSHSKLVLVNVLLGCKENMALHTLRTGESRWRLLCMLAGSAFGVSRLFELQVLQTMKSSGL